MLQQLQCQQNKTCTKKKVRLDLKRKILKAEQVKYQSHELTSQHQNLHLKLPIATNFFG